MNQKKPFYRKWWFYAIIVFVILGVIFSPSDEERAEMEATEKAQIAEVKAEQEAKKQAKADAKKAEEEAEQAKVDAVFTDFNDETKPAIMQLTDGAITDATIDYTGVHYKVNVFVDELAWAASTESEKESFAVTTGDFIQKTIPDTSLVDFRSATNDDIVAEGKILGGYKIKR